MPTTNRSRSPKAASLIERNSLGRWVLLVSALLGAGALFGCVDAEVDPATISAKVIFVGAYSGGDEIPTFVEARTDIPCDVGRIFGLDYKLEVANGASGVLPIEFKWLHPKLRVKGSLRPGTETEGGVSNLVMKRGHSQRLGRSLWRISDESERVPGVYRFEIRTVQDKRVLLSQEFKITGC